MRVLIRIRRVIITHKAGVMPFINNTSWQYADCYNLWSLYTTAISNLNSLTSTTVIDDDNKMRSTPSLSTATDLNERTRTAHGLGTNQVKRGKFQVQPYCFKVLYLPAFILSAFLSADNDNAVMIIDMRCITDCLYFHDDDFTIRPSLITTMSICACSSSNLATHITGNS